MNAVIVDANAAHRLFKSDDEVGKEIWRLIEQKSIQCPCGGTKYIDELSRTVLGRVYTELLRRGSLRRYESQDVDALAEQYEQDPAVTSDDPHMLALAHRSGCRVLFSADAALSNDFKNRNILPKPRGKVINSVLHEHVIRSAPSCRG